MTESTGSPPSDVYVVTGATGYIASWIVHELLSRGFTVRGSTRDSRNRDKCQHLLDMAEELPGTLSLFDADLLTAGSFDAAIEGADYVIHAASPFILGAVEDPKRQLYEPAVEGTEHVLASVERSASVRRVVLTSSVLAVTGDNDSKGQGGVFDESDWNQTCNLEHRPYVHAKTEAERRAWEICSKQSRWSMVAMNPGFVLGPSRSTRVDSESVRFLLDLLEGKLAAGVPSLLIPLADVRTVAQAHVNACTLDEASGRYLIVAGMVSVLDVAQILRERYGSELGLPRREVTKLLMLMLGPRFGFTRQYARHNFNVNYSVDSSRSHELGLDYRSVEATVLDQAEQLIRDGIVELP